MASKFSGGWGGGLGGRRGPGELGYEVVDAMETERSDG